MEKFETFEDIMTARQKVSDALRAETDRKKSIDLAGELNLLTKEAYDRFPVEMGNHRRETARKVVENAKARAAQ